MGILIGTDFNTGIEGVGAKTGLKIVQKGEFAAKIAEKCPGFDPVPVMDLFLRPPVTTEYTLSWAHPDAEGIKRMLCDEYDFARERVDAALERYTVKSGQKTLESWF